MGEGKGDYRERERKSMCVCDGECIYEWKWEREPDIGRVERGIVILESSVCLMCKREREREQITIDDTFKLYVLYWGLVCARERRTDFEKVCVWENYFILDSQ